MLQHDKSAWVVLPHTTHDMGSTMETMRKMRLVEDVAFVRAEHSTTGVSSSYSVLLDLRLLELDDGPTLQRSTTSRADELSIHLCASEFG